MATFKVDTALKYLTNKGGDIEDVQFKAGENVTVVQVWEKYYLVRDQNGHYYNVRKEKVDE